MPTRLPSHRPFENDAMLLAFAERAFELARWDPSWEDDEEEEDRADETGDHEWRDLASHQTAQPFFATSPGEDADAPWTRDARRHGRDALRAVASAMWFDGSAALLEVVIESLPHVGHAGGAGDKLHEALLEGVARMVARGVRLTAPARKALARWPSWLLESLVTALPPEAKAACALLRELAGHANLWVARAAAERLGPAGAPWWTGRFPADPLAGMDAAARERWEPACRRFAAALDAAARQRLRGWGPTEGAGTEAERPLAAALVELPPALREEAATALLRAGASGVEAVDLWKAIALLPGGLDKALVLHEELRGGHVLGPLEFSVMCHRLAPEERRALLEQVLARMGDAMERPVDWRAVRTDFDEGEPSYVALCEALLAAAPHDEPPVALLDFFWPAPAAGRRRRQRPVPHQVWHAVKCYRGSWGERAGELTEALFSPRHRLALVAAEVWPALPREEVRARAEALLAKKGASPDQVELAARILLETHPPEDRAGASALLARLEAHPQARPLLRTHFVRHALPFLRRELRAGRLGLSDAVRVAREVARLHGDSSLDGGGAGGTDEEDLDARGPLTDEEWSQLWAAAENAAGGEDPAWWEILSTVRPGLPWADAERRLVEAAFRAIVRGEADGAAAVLMKVLPSKAEVWVLGALDAAIRDLPEEPEDEMADLDLKEARELVRRVLAYRASLAAG